MRKSGMTFFVGRKTCCWLGALLACLWLTSCAGLKPGAGAPSDHTVTLDQLVFHSNFELPQKHRLLDELTAQRGLLASKLELPVSDEPIHVYLFSTADELRDYTKIHYPQAPDRRAFFVETDTRLTVYAYWGDHVAEDLRHEVAHGYLHAVAQNLPLWLDEGLAEYFEVPRSQKGLNQPHVEELKKLLAKNWIPDVKRMERFRSAGEMTQADYAEAWAWVYFLLETTPERRRALCDYMHIVSRGELAPDLSAFLTNARLYEPRKVADYVAALGAAPAKEPLE